MDLVLTKIKQKLNYKLLFENAISGICLTDYEGNIIDCNETFLQLSDNESIESIYPKNISAYLSRADGETFDFKKLKEDLTSQFYLDFSSQTGRQIPCLISAKIIELESENYLLINLINTSKEANPELKKHFSKDEKDSQIRALKEKLLLSERKFQKAMELSNSAVCIQSESKILFVNKAWETLTDYTFKETEGHSPCFLIHPDYKKLAQNRFLARLAGKKVPDKYDLKIITKTKKDIWVNVKVSIVDYEDQKALLTVFEDISERMRTQQSFKESKKKFQSLFYENNSIMFVVDPQSGQIVDANEAACMFYGYSKAKMTSLNIKDISALSENEIQDQIDAAMNGKREHYLFKHKLSNNEIRDVEIYSGKVEIKETILLYSVVHDITARKKAEEALKQSENKLKQLNAQKDRFFSIIAHDLRGPIGSFMQLTEYIKENHQDLSDADFKKYFNHIYSAAKGTFKLLENLLFWTRSQLGVLDIKPQIIDIQELANETIAIYAESARAKDIEIKNLVAGNSKAYADKNTIATVIRNLLANAIKFTQNGGVIIIDSAGKLVENNKFIEIFVKDSGIGIPEEKIDKLFRIEENYTTYGTNNEKGTGLGLILCKELVEKNHGEIWVDSTAGKETIFGFSLPVET